MSQEPAVPSSIALLETYLAAHPLTQHIHLSFVDYHAVTRTRVISKSRALQLASKPDTPSVTSAGPSVYSLPSFGGMYIDLLRESGIDDEWVPDWTTLRQVGGEVDSAIVWCFVKDKSAAPGAEYALDPRKAIQRVEGKAAKEGVEFLVGYEVEFNFFHPTESASESPKPVEGANQMWTASALRRPLFKVVTDVVAHLEANGVKVWVYHIEGSGYNQYEIALAPTTPSKAVDNLHFTQHTIRTIAAKAGYLASLHPSAEGGATNGSHVHLSHNRSDAAETFLAGMIQHLSAVRSFTNGGYDSYGPRDWTNGHNVAYWSGIKNAPIRRINETRFELRQPDVLSNQALQLAAILASGVDGIINKTAVAQTEVHNELTVEPMSEETREKLGAKLLPKSLAEALDALEADRAVFDEWIGKEVIDGYLLSKKKEIKTAEGMTVSERSRALIRNI